MDFSFKCQPKKPSLPWYLRQALPDKQTILIKSQARNLTRQNLPNSFDLHKFIKPSYTPKPPSKPRRFQQKIFQKKVQKYKKLFFLKDAHIKLPKLPLTRRRPSAQNLKIRPRKNQKTGVQTNYITIETSLQSLTQGCKQMDEEQEKYLQDAGSIVRQQAYYMQRAIDQSNREQALKYASTMIQELKTSLLSPRTYYELYMQVFDNLSRLESYFMQQYRKGASISSLYQRVQYFPSILPRIYLLITVGSAFIQTKQVSTQEILKDLIQMTKGVQHPVRGLFLRYYLNKMCKDKLPDSNSVDGGDVTDSLDFLLQNLSEMNRLWVRMQHTGNVRDKNRREKERSDLRVTVGENIVRLSSLQGITIELYKTIVLPKVLQVVTSSKDVISQQYLMDCIIQAFSDQYHLHTLEPLLQASTQLEASVQVKTIFINLLNRLSDHSGQSEMEIVRQIDIFNLIKNYVDKVIVQGNAGQMKKLLQLQVAFLRLSLKCYPDNTENVNSILESCVTLVQRHASDGKLDPQSLRSIVKLLSFPLDTLSLAILSMNHFPRLMNFLQFSQRKQVATKIVQTVVNSRKSLSGINSTSQLLQFISPLLQDALDATDEQEYEFQDQQLLVARLAHLISSKNPSKHLAILNKVRQAFSLGGVRRTVFTSPALVFAYVRFFGLAQDQSLQEQALRTALEIIATLTEDNPELAINLYLQSLLALNSVQVSSYTSELGYQIGNMVLKIYQNELYHSDSKLNSIKLIAAALIHLKCCDQDSLQALVTTCTQYSARQLKKSDQCEGVVACTHLFWNQQTQHQRRVVQCLQKGLRIASICQTGAKNTMLYVMALNKYLFYFLQESSPIDVDSINSLQELARETLEMAEKDPEVRNQIQEAKKYFNNTLKMISSRKSNGQLVGVN